MMNGTKKRVPARNTDNFAVRCAKSALYTVLLWIYRYSIAYRSPHKILFSVYNCIMYVWRKQYRAVSIV